MNDPAVSALAGFAVGYCGMLVLIATAAMVPWRCAWTRIVSFRHVERHEGDPATDLYALYFTQISKACVSQSETDSTTD